MFRKSYFDVQQTILYMQVYLVCFPYMLRDSCMKTYHIRLYIEYSLPEDEHKMFETCRRQEVLN
jgi:hypothetical protein